MPSAAQTQLLGSPEYALSPVARCKRIFLALIAVLVLSSEFSGTALLVWFGQAPLEQFAPWLHSQETAGTAIFLGVWVAGSVLCLPSTPLWLLGGFCFKQNFYIGLSLNAFGCWFGSLICFGIGRLMQRCCGGMSDDGESEGGCCGGCARSRELRILRSLLERNEWKACFLSRLAYAPMAVKNYGFGGVTPVSFSCFMPSSLLGDFPNTVLFTHLGGSVSSIVDAVQGKEQLGTAPKVGLVISITCTATILLLVGYYVKKQLRDEEVRISQSIQGPTAEVAGGAVATAAARPTGYTSTRRV